MPCLLFSWGLENADEANTNNSNNLVVDESVILMGTLSTHWMIIWMKWFDDAFFRTRAFFTVRWRKVDATYRKELFIYDAQIPVLWIRCMTCWQKLGIILEKNVFKIEVIKGKSNLKMFSWIVIWKILMIYCNFSLISFSLLIFGRNFADYDLPLNEIHNLAPTIWKNCLSGWKFMDSHKTHKAFVQMAKRLERTSNHNEFCSEPSTRLVPKWHLCERHRSSPSVSTFFPICYKLLPLRY